MKVRVYDSARGRKERHKFENYIDRYCLYFPNPKKVVEETYNLLGETITGTFLRFSFESDGRINRCAWDEWNRRDGYVDNLGKKVNIDTLPEKVREWIREYERRWNNYISSNSTQAEREWEQMW